MEQILIGLETVAFAVSAIGGVIFFVFIVMLVKLMLDLAESEEDMKNRQQAKEGAED